jgi:hypothetical protein
MSPTGNEAPTQQTQLDALHAIPAQDMLVDPAELALVLEEPSEEDRLPWSDLLGWTLATLAVTIVAAIWWAALGH